MKSHGLHVVVGHLYMVVPHLTVAVQDIRAEQQTGQENPKVYVEAVFVQEDKLDQDIELKLPIDKLQAAASVTTASLPTEDQIKLKDSHNVAKLEVC